MNHTGRHHRALLLQHGKHVRRSHAERSQLILIHFDINFLLLDTEKFYLLHILHTCQAPPDIFRIFTFFFIRKSVSRDGVNRAVHIIEPVINIRPHDSRRQAAPFIIDQIAYFMPAGLHLLFRHRIFQIDINHGFTVMGERFDIIEPLGILQFLFQRIRHLLRDLLRRSARPCSRNHGLSDCKIRVFAAPQMEIGPQSARNDGNNEKIDNLFMPDRPFCQIQAFHNRTSSPSCSFCTPAVTTRSPFCRPETISTVSFPYCPVSTFCRYTL